MANRRYNLNDNYFDVIDTEGKAYFLGLLVADGTNYENGQIKLELMESDSYILEVLSNEMNYEGTVKHYPPEEKVINGKPCMCDGLARLVVKSNHMSERLSELWCIQNKSLTEHHLLSYRDVPENLYNHYIRGYFDGNGSISYHDSGYSTGTLKFALSFCGNEHIIHDLSSFIGEKFDCHPSEASRYPDRDNHNLQTGICGNRLIYRFCEWMYKNSNIFLKRKYEKFLLLEENNKKVDQRQETYGSCKQRRGVVYLPTQQMFSSMAEAERATGVNRSQICTECKGSKKRFIYTDDFITRGN